MPQRAVNAADAKRNGSDAVWDNLVARRIGAACEAAISRGDVRLATLVAQVRGV